MGRRHSLWSRAPSVAAWDIMNDKKVHRSARISKLRRSFHHLSLSLLRIPMALYCHLLFGGQSSWQPRFFKKKYGAKVRWQHWRSMHASYRLFGTVRIFVPPPPPFSMRRQKYPPPPLLSCPPAEIVVDLWARRPIYRPRGFFFATWSLVPWAWPCFNRRSRHLGKLEMSWKHEYAST